MHRSSQDVICWGVLTHCGVPSLVVRLAVGRFVPSSGHWPTHHPEASAIFDMWQRELGLLTQQLFLRNPVALLLAELNFGTHFTTLT